MTGFVLDASALLALLLAEPGADRVKAELDGSVMTTVNLAEVVSHYAKLGAARPDIEALLRPLPIRWAAVDAALHHIPGPYIVLGNFECKLLIGRGQIGSPNRSGSRSTRGLRCAYSWS